MNTDWNHRPSVEVCGKWQHLLKQRPTVYLFKPLVNDQHGNWNIDINISMYISNVLVHFHKLAMCIWLCLVFFVCVCVCVCASVSASVYVCLSAGLSSEPYFTYAERHSCGVWHYQLANGDLSQFPVQCKVHKGRQRKQCLSWSMELVIEGEIRS